MKKKERACVFMCACGFACVCVYKRQRERERERKSACGRISMGSVRVKEWAYVDESFISVFESMPVILPSLRPLYMCKLVS